MTTIVILNIVFAAFVVIGIVALLGTSILFDRAARAEPEGPRLSRARSRRPQPARRGFGAAFDAS